MCAGIASSLARFQLMPSTPISGAFNDGYIAEQYELFRRDPALVDESWRQFFRLARSFSGTATTSTAAAPSTDENFLRKIASAAMLIQDIRAHGHYAVAIDPLGTPPIGAVELTPEFHGITTEDLDSIPARAMGFEWDGIDTAGDVVAKLRQLYSSNIGFETEHLDEDRERQWFHRMIEEERFPRTLNESEKRALLERLTEVDGLERFLGRAFLGHKRFSIEGSDVLVPMMDTLIQSAAGVDASEVVIAMAHRGRINVLAHVLGKPYASIFEEFADEHLHANVAGSSGDVKYHLGARATKVLPDGGSVRIGVIPNPSHLEFVNPVMAGVARARQRVNKSSTRDARKVLPVCIHGDAAFPGEGIVAETFNLARLRAYHVGGTVHIIVNNQIGYTTAPTDARSTYYDSDPAKGFDVPVVHVSADDPEACIAAVKLGVAFRAEFGQDFLIDVVGYRRHGHNEGDEPAYTQPTLYAGIKAHKTVRVLWGERLVSEGVVTAEDVRAIDQAVTARLEAALAEQKAGPVHAGAAPPSSSASQRDPQLGASGAHMVVAEATAITRELLVELNDRMLSWPAGFKIHPKLAKQLERRRASITAQGGIDWGHAEALAFASLLRDGMSVRMSGQDAERGTFSHRHAVLHDYESDQTFTPLQHIPGAKGSFEIYNSPLSEMSVVGFEYGFSTAAPDALTLWEAQFGDFVNVAQPLMDQFIFADRAKWGQESGLVMLLPHGYEGQGPEHSSARLERFLQSCAEGNMRVANPTTPAQYFHILRRQANPGSRRPLVLMQPKSLLRRPDAASSIDDLASGEFHAVIDDRVAVLHADAVRRLVFCSGKIYYDIMEALGKMDAEARSRIAVARVEELYPWPHEQIGLLVDRYPEIEEIVWAQEEPRNMGAWTYALPRLHASAGNVVKVSYVGRPERASTAEGYKAAHDLEQKRIVDAVVEIPQLGTVRSRRSAART